MSTPGGGGTPKYVNGVCTAQGLYLLTWHYIQKNAL